MPRKFRFADGNGDSRYAGQEFELVRVSWEHDVTQDNMAWVETPDGDHWGMYDEWGLHPLFHPLSEFGEWVD